jgi:hypothetical protein
MLLPHPDISLVSGDEKIRWERDDVATAIVDFESTKQKLSQRQFAQQKGIPRTTLQHWLSRKENLDASPVIIEFFESPEGLAFLHRLVTAAHFEFGKNSPASIHSISNFFKLIGIGPFIASSYATQSRASKRMDEAIVLFGESEQKRLSKDMPAKKITLCEDETFHPQTCVVSMEAVSNFIFLEKYVKDRSGQTWNNEVNQALAGLPNVEVIQVVSDEAKGLLNHTLKGLGVHHSPDCFHVPHEIGKGTSGPLAGAIKKSEKQVEVATKQEQKEKKRQENFDNQPKRPRGRRPNFEGKIAIAAENVKQAEKSLEAARQNQETVLTAKRDIGRFYHPYNPETGEKQDAQCISDILEDTFKKIDNTITELPDPCKKRVEKAHRVVKDMVASIAFFFHMIDMHMENMGISEAERQIMHLYLIPGFYLEQVARKERDPFRKEEISQKSHELLSKISDQNAHFKDYSDDQIMVLKKGAKECADIFQRSSSCVEGRNAQLSLRHHGIHRLSNLHLKSLTTVHNYHTRRRDGTTPAERFFEAKHADLFEWLLNNMSYPARPRKTAVLGEGLTIWFYCVLKNSFSHCFL